MATRWVRISGASALTANNTHSGNFLIYRNSITVTGSITLVQKATVVSTYLFGVTDTEDVWSMSICEVPEGAAAAYADPAREDQQLKGQYMFARGPMLYQPRRLVSIGTETDLVLRINKEEGNTVASRLHWYAGFLLQTSL